MKLKKNYNWNKISNLKDALLWSIAKWIGIGNNSIHDEACDNCGCCKYVTNKFTFPECLKCKIRKYANEHDCHNTPYRDYTNNPTKVNAIKERDFLIKVYRKYYGEFSFKEFKKTAYKTMIEQLKK